MLKEDVISFIVYLLMVAIAAIVGFAIINPAFSSISTVNGWSVTGFLIICLIIAVILEVIIFELGHIIGAKFGKYDIISVNILGFCFYKKYYKENNKTYWKFKFPKGFDGLTGETIVMPKSEKSNPTMVVLSPLIFFAVEVALLVFAYAFIPDKVSGSQNPIMFLKYFQLIVVTIGGMLFIYNYFPAKLDTITDGYRLVCLNKKINIEAYNELLKIDGDEFLGVESNSYKTFDTITDFTALVNLSSVRNYLKTGDYEKALPLVDLILANKEKVSNNTLCMAKVYKLNMLLMYKSNKEAQDFFDAFETKEKDYLKSNYSMLTIRTAILYYGIIEKSQSECEMQMHYVKKALQKETEISKGYEDKFLKETVALLKEKNPEIKVNY